MHFNHTLTLSKLLTMQTIPLIEQTFWWNFNNCLLKSWQNLSKGQLITLLWQFLQLIFMSFSLGSKNNFSGLLCLRGLILHKNSYNVFTFHVVATPTMMPILAIHSNFTSLSLFPCLNTVCYFSQAGEVFGIQDVTF